MRRKQVRRAGNAECYEKTSMSIRLAIGILSLLVLCPLVLPAQDGMHYPDDANALPAPAPLPDPMPGDVLTPDKRTNSPNLKLAFKIGFNRSAYSNDRYPDNRPFDIGTVFGEADVYGSAAGFGSQVGIGVEIPRNTVFSWVVTAQFDHVFFGNNGPVDDVCLSPEGDTLGTGSIHTFEATIDYLKLAGAAKLNFRSFYLLGGLTAGTPLRNTILFERDHDGGRCFYPEPRDIRNSTEPVEIPGIATLHFALRIGAGLNYPISDRLQFSPELILDFGFNAINKSPESDLGVYAVNAVLRYEL